MSREKFEEWCNTEDGKKASFYWSHDEYKNSAYAAWLAGRESMRDEAAQVCKDAAEDGSESDGYETAYSCAHQIEEIKP